MEHLQAMGMPSQSILREKEDLEKKCQLIEDELPAFMAPFFRHLVGSFEPKSRLAYLRETKRLMEYLEFTHGINPYGSSDLCHVNIGQIDAYLRESARNENGSKALLRKRSIINSLFKQLSYESLVDDDVAKNVGKIPVKPQSFSTIKKPWQGLDKTLEGIKDGSFLTDKEKQYWEKTRHRDYLILELFGRMGLLAQEVYHLDIRDIDIKKMRLRVYGKGGREEWLPFDEDTGRALQLFIDKERKPIKSNGDPLLLSLKGLRLSKRQLREITKKYTGTSRGRTRDEGLSPQRLRGINQKANLDKEGFNQ
jgi:site-specific recombinase XerD